MARPKTDSNQPSATERMRRAFWELLAQKSYDEFSIKDICARANVQRNTFYYHYAGIADLAADSIAVLPVERFARGMIALLQTDEPHPADYIFSKQNQEFIGSMFLLAGPHGTSALTETVKSRIWTAWRALVDLPEERPIAADFALGGLFAAIGKLGQLTPEKRMAAVENIPAKAIAMTLFQQLFGASLDTLILRSPQGEETHPEG